MNGQVLTGWKHMGYPLTNNISAIPTSPNVTGVKLPAYFSGTLKLPQAQAPYQDTFVDTTGWGKVRVNFHRSMNNVAFINL